MHILSTKEVLLRACLQEAIETLIALPLDGLFEGLPPYGRLYGVALY